MSVFLILLVHSSLGIERTGRLFVDNDLHGLQVQVDHLLQELNALKSDFNREISYLKSQLATQGQEISTCRGIKTLESLRYNLLIIVTKQTAKSFMFSTKHPLSFKC